MCIRDSNPLLGLINEQMAAQSAPSRADRYQTRERRASSSAAHRRIYEAIAAGDGELAEVEAREHVRDISRTIAAARGAAAQREAAQLTTSEGQEP